MRYLGAYMRCVRCGARYLAHRPRVILDLPAGPTMVGVPDPAFPGATWFNAFCALPACRLSSHSPREVRHGRYCLTFTRLDPPPQEREAVAAAHALGGWDAVEAMGYQDVPWLSLVEN